MLYSAVQESVTFYHLVSMKISYRPHMRFLLTLENYVHLANLHLRFKMDSKVASHYSWPGHDLERDSFAFIHL